MPGRRDVDPGVVAVDDGDRLAVANPGHAGREG